MRIASVVVASLWMVAGCNREGVVNGSVFIVTRGGENVKLALVKVAAVPEQTMINDLKSKKAELDNYAKREDEIQNIIKAAPYKGDKYNAALKELGSIEEPLKAARDLSAFIFRSTPRPIAIATTDADGKFSFVLPSRAKVVLIAHGSRDLGEDTERYYWLRSFSMDGASTKTVVLSNQNMLSEDWARVALSGLLLTL